MWKKFYGLTEPDSIMHIDNCQSFLNYLRFEKRYSDHTVTAYKADIGQFIGYISGLYNVRDWQEVEHMHIRSWMIELLESGIKPRSIARKLSSLRTFFQFKKRAGEVKINPMLKIIVPKSGKSLPETVSADKIEKLFDTIDMGKPLEFRDRLILELFYTTGMRRSELIGLKDQDIDPGRMRLKVLGKGNKERNIPLSQTLLDKLGQWQLKRDTHFGTALSGDTLFVTDKGHALYPKWIYNMVKRYLSTITMQQKRSPHVLRHSFATHLMDGGAELNAVKELLGHASLAATQVYTHNSIEKLKSVYKSAHPRSHQKT